MTGDTGLRKLFMDELRDVYHAEKQLTKALPKLAKAATSSELRDALESHLQETQRQVSRLEECFGLLDEPVKAKPCAGMMGIVQEGSDLIEEEEKGSMLDAGLIASAQRAEHYEMAAYGSLRAWAMALGEDDVVELLEATLEEEKAADEKLSALAEGGINEAAVEGEEEGDDSEPVVAASGRGASSKSTSMRGSSGSKSRAR
jgi:ferritin-like metal-binding protein YciE